MKKKKVLPLSAMIVLWKANRMLYKVNPFTEDSLIKKRFIKISCTNKDEDYEFGLMLMVKKNAMFSNETTLPSVSNSASYSKISNTELSAYKQIFNFVYQAYREGYKRFKIQLI